MENTICLTVTIYNFKHLSGPVCITSNKTCRTDEMISMLRQIGAQPKGFETQTWNYSGNLAQVTSQLVGVGYNVVTTTVVSDSVLVMMQLRSDLVTGPVNG